MKYKVVMIFIFLIVFSGCSSKKELDIDSYPKMQVPKVVQPPVKKKGSLYSRRGASLFSDKKDLQVGDIIQILIEETLTNESSANRKTAKSNTTGLNGGLFSPAVTTSDKLNKKLDQVNGITGIGFNASSTSSYNGSASSSADEEFTTTISAIIEQTYQNGNYFIKGSKDMLINGQKQTIKISGVIRPYDISPENTVNSNQLANLKIMYEKDGEEMDALKKPWGSRFLESISPF